MLIDPELLRSVMRHWATGVTILSSRDGDQAHGMTVSSFTSVALDPPLVLASLETNVRTHAMVQRSGVFAVTFLREGQSSISDRFAGRETDDNDRFNDLETFSLVTGAPILTDNIGCLDCVVVAGHAAGDHTLFVAEVVAAQTGSATVSAQPGDGDARPLLYFNRAYREMR